MSSQTTSPLILEFINSLTVPELRKLAIRDLKHRRRLAYSGDAYKLGKQDLLNRIECAYDLWYYDYYDTEFDSAEIERLYKLINLRGRASKKMVSEVPLTRHWYHDLPPF